MTTEKPPLKPLSAQEWETLIDDFHQDGGEKWRSLYPIHSLVDAALSSLLKKDFPLTGKLPLLIFLEEFALSFFNDTESQSLDRLTDTLRSIVQSPVDTSYGLKEQMMVSSTSILISINEFQCRHVQAVVDLLIALVNRPNHGFDRQTRAVACECLRQLEKAFPGLLSDVTGHIWSMCQAERTHASQAYLLLFATVVFNVIDRKLNVSILNTSMPLVPFSVPHWMEVSGNEHIVSGGGPNLKELRRAMAFLLEWPQVFTPSAMAELMGMVMPLAVALDLQASMLRVQFLGLIYSFDPVLFHVVLTMCSEFPDSFNEQTVEIARRLMQLSMETQLNLVFRILALHWLLGLLNKLSLNGELAKNNSILKMGLKFYPVVFDPLALKALKLDLVGLCSFKYNSSNEDETVKLFKDGLVSISAFKWLPPWSTETTVAFRAFHKFLIGSSAHSEANPSISGPLMECTIFRALQGMLVDMTLEFQRLVPVIVAFVDRLFGCKRHCWLGERLLQKIDESLLSRITIDHKLVPYFPLFDRIAENKTIPPGRLINLLMKFIAFLVEKHGPDMELKSWSQGSKVLGICRTMLMHHYSSRLFLGLSRLLAFTCLYFPDLEVRDHARIYLRMLISIPGRKLKHILTFAEGVSPSANPSTFFNVQSPRHHHGFNKSRNISLYIHLERVTSLLVKQSWSLALSLGDEGNKSAGYAGGIRDSEPLFGESEHDSDVNFQSSFETERIDPRNQTLRVMDTRISEILGTLRQYFLCIPDFRHMDGLKVRISCTLRFESEGFSSQVKHSSPSGLDGVDGPAAIYATVLKFSSSAPYGSIPPCRVPFLIGESSQHSNVSSEGVSLDMVPLEYGFEKEESFKAPVTIELEPREPTPGLVDVMIETNLENGQMIKGQVESINVGIEDMFLKALVPSEILEDAVPAYYLDLFNALWEVCGSSNAAREVFLLEGGRGAATISGTRSVKLLEIPAGTLIQATEQYLASFVVSITGEQLVNTVKDGGIIRDIVWKDDADSESGLDSTTVGGPLLYLTYTGYEANERNTRVNKTKMGCIDLLIFLPPRFHLLLQMEVGEYSTLFRIRTDHWPCLAYIDDYLEALFLV